MRRPSRTLMEIRRLPGATHLKVQTTYHEAFNAELKRAVPWPDLRWEKSATVGWLIWVRADYLPLLRRLAFCFDRAILIDVDGQSCTDLHSGRTWPLVPPAEQLDLFAEGDQR
jgi:hypothetical protein